MSPAALPLWWNGRGELLCGRVKVASVRCCPFGPVRDDDPGPWFGEVGSGFPAPFEDWFCTESEARGVVQAAARRLLLEGGR